MFGDARSCPSEVSTIGGGNVPVNDFWTLRPEQALQITASHPEGLSQVEASQRLEKLGPNVLQTKKETSPLILFLKQLNNPIMFILLFACLVSFFTNDFTDGLIIMLIIFFSSLLSFYQEYTASNAAKSLMKLVSLDSHVLRDGEVYNLPVKQLTQGDVLLLKAGDFIPADCLILTQNALEVDESTLTGESLPVEKDTQVRTKETPLMQRSNCLWMGTHIVSGSCKALIMNLAKDSLFGELSKSLAKKEEPTDFEVAISSYGYLLLKWTIVIMGTVFTVNLACHKPVFESLMFSLALAVGITPQMLPAIFSVNLSVGAKNMAKKGVIVKKLSAIENFGSMDILCSDKTGTITKGQVEVLTMTDAQGKETALVKLLAKVNAALQEGYVNPIDQAIVDYTKEVDISDYHKCDEIPYSFKTKTLSLISQTPKNSYFEGRDIIVTKGAVKEILDRSSKILLEGKIEELDGNYAKIYHKFEKYSDQGLRVMALAYGYGKQAEDLIFLGFILLSDPLKEGMVETIQAINQLEVKLKIITGDNRLIAKHLAKQLGLDPTAMMTGDEVARLTNRQLAIRAQDCHIFAEIDPNQKEDIIVALKSTGHVVGFMGDGINDASAIHFADVGISVNTAQDTAKEAASIVLLRQDLNVLIDGIKEGRRTFANTLKYIFIATSANFGNMFSMAGASFLLPFLPLLSKQILLTNLLTDLPSLYIANDNVDSEWVNDPITADLGFIKKFTVTFGVISSVFDFITFFILLNIAKVSAVGFHTAWFVESVISATIAMLVIRTARPLGQSRPNRKLLLAIIGIDLCVVALPFTPIAGILGFKPLSSALLISIVTIVLTYGLLLEGVKKIFYRANSL